MAARATQEALHKKAADFYFQSGQNPLAPIGNSPNMDRNPKYPSTFTQDPAWHQSRFDTTMGPPQYTPLNSNSMSSTDYLSTENFLQYRPPRPFNYSEDPFTQTGLPKDGINRVTELHYLGSGHYPGQEREPSVQFPLPVPPVFLNHTGRIAIGTPDVTKAILAKSAAAQKLVPNSTYLPDKTIAWLVHSENKDGHEKVLASLPTLTDPNNPEEFVHHDMLSYMKLSYPQQYNAYINHDHLPKLTPSTLDVRIPTGGDLKGWLNKIQTHFLPYFSGILKALVQADPLNDENTQTKFVEIKREYIKNPTSTSPEKFLLKELSVYNYSGTILGKIISASIDCERDLFAPVLQALL